MLSTPEGYAICTSAISEMCSSPSRPVRIHKGTIVYDVRSLGVHNISDRTPVVDADPRILQQPFDRPPDVVIGGVDAEQQVTNAIADSDQSSRVSDAPQETKM
jgi:hypothetical protein